MRILFIILLTLSLGILGFKSIQHFLNLNLHQAEDYEWVESSLSYCSELDSSPKATQKSSPTITIKVDTFKQYLSINSGLGGGYRLLRNHPKKDALKIGLKLAVQLKKHKVRTLETGFVYASNPTVYGLQLEGEPIFSVEDLNRNLRQYNNTIGGIYLLAFALLLIVLILVIKKVRN
jgi:hypothetical protein